ncbi:MAG TPA: cysteine--tRNA ligase [Spirochaetales bacterium]|nr:cysteine--tRNA ligase [Spirochaetales bacterium]HPM71926.1 cysteine--tRNA ligase [Spirochaetales bacterium]
MGLRLYNTLGRSLQEFEPIQPGKVGFYGCGPTVYNYAHIGNMRMYVFEDTLARALRYLGYEVTHVMNITDVGHLSGDADSGEDKMVKSAQERHKSVLEIARYYTDAFFADEAKLNILRPDVVCNATEHVDDMISLIRRLEANGYTYFAGGNLYFDVSKFPSYGEMAGLKLDELKAGARIEVDANKRNPYDFVLWFTKSKFEDQALQWDSPWGRGYPGWHVECSAMSMKYLGEQFDIHAGGIDHVAIHHTNEIAQSEGATGKKWVNYWLHGEFLVLDKGKMSKSAGGFLTLKTLTDAGYEALDYRYFLLGAHYRSQLQFSYDGLDSARASRRSLVERVLALREKLHGGEPTPLATLCPAAKARLVAFKAAIEDDLSTPRALAELWGVLKEQGVSAADALGAAFDMDRVLGLGLESLAREAQAAVDPALAAELDALVAERAVAKKAKDYKRADAIRDELKARGVILEDSPAGTSWKLAPSVAGATPSVAGATPSVTGATPSVAGATPPGSAPRA